MAVLTSLGVEIGIGTSADADDVATSFTKIPQVIEMSEIDLDEMLLYLINTYHIKDFKIEDISIEDITKELYEKNE